MFMKAWEKGSVIFFILALALFMSSLQEDQKPVPSIAEAKICVNESVHDTAQNDCGFDSGIISPSQITDTPIPNTFQNLRDRQISPNPTTFPSVSTKTTMTTSLGADPTSNKLKITFYKSPAPCRCCDKYFEYIAAYGFEVEVIDTPDMAAITSEFQIPHDLESCHTAVIEDYFVEGHVPIEAINKLLSERPEIDGITLPGKPYGAPGRRGAKTTKFKIYALSDGEASIFMIL
jgi:hypothetical protein